MNIDNQLRLKIATRIAAALNSNPKCTGCFEHVTGDAFAQADSLLKYAAQYEQPAGEASKAHQDDLDLYHVRAWAEKHNIRGDYESVTAAFFDARNR